MTIILLVPIQWVIQIRLEDGHEYLIQAPDLTVRDEWKTAIEHVVRNLERLQFSPDRSTMKLIGGDSLATTTTKRYAILSPIEQYHAGQTYM